MKFPTHWYYSGPYVPSGVVYDPNRNINDKPIPSYSVWLVPGYERWIDNIAAIDVYGGPSYASSKLRC